MKKFSLLCVFIVLQGTALMAADFRNQVLLNGPWQSVITKDPNKSPPVTGWEDSNVPAVFRGNARGGSSFVWLSRKISIPENWLGQRIFVRLNHARYGPHVFVNGQLMGNRLDGWTPTEVEITQAITKAGEYQLQVRCQDKGATFVPGFEIPAEGRTSTFGKVLALDGGHHDIFGPYDDIWLFARPKTYIDDIIITPSVRKKVLAVNGKISKVIPKLWVEGEVLDGKKSVLKIRATKVSADGNWKISAKFPSARHWSPEDPHLYILRLTLRKDRKDGLILDILEERFGFKEFWIEGPDFYLNGVKRHLLATSTWPSSSPQTREVIRSNLEKIKEGNNVAFRCHTAPWQKAWVELADEIGIMIIDEGALYTDQDGRYAYTDERFWQNYRDHLEGIVRRDRNNASLIMWSIENESLFMNNTKYDPNLESKLADIGRFVKQLDPYHPITYEGSFDPDGAADVIGLHYPHELPHHADWPNTGDWLGKTVETDAGGGMLGERRSRFKWDRKKPLYIGEYLWVPQMDYSPGSIFFGDEAYIDLFKFRFKAQVLSWIDQTIAYRRAGVSGLCPWTAFAHGGGIDPQRAELYRAQKDFYRPVAAFIGDKVTRYFVGRKINKTFDIFNDSPNTKSLQLKWKLLPGKAKGHKKLKLKPAEYKPVTVRLNLPKKPGDYTLKWVLLADGKEVHADSRTLKVELCNDIRLPKKNRVVLYDPKSKWKHKQKGFKSLKSLSRLAKANPATDILVIGPEAISKTDSAKGVIQIGKSDFDSQRLLEFLKKGGRAIVLEQESLFGLGLGIRLVDHASTMTFAINKAHPVLRDFEPEDLKFWGPDHYVTRREIVRLDTGCAKAVTVSGGMRVLYQAPIVEMPVGRGAVVLIQALVAEKFNTEPAARRLLQNTIDYLAAHRAEPGRTCVLSQDDVFTSKLSEMGLIFDELKGPAQPSDLKNANLLVLHGADQSIIQSKGVIESYLKNPAPRTVYWHKPDANTFNVFKEIFNTQNCTIQPMSGSASIRLREHPLLSGVSREDLTFTSRVSGWHRSLRMEDTVVDTALFPEITDKKTRRIEAETFELTGRSASVDSSGKLVLLNNFSGVSGNIYVSKDGIYAISLLAGVESVENANPMVFVSCDDTFVSQVHLTHDKTRPYPFLAELTSGWHKLDLQYFAGSRWWRRGRDLSLDAILITEEPLDLEKAQLLTLPPALVVLPAGTGKVVIDTVCWDKDKVDNAKAHRYIAGLLSNLGASFKLSQGDIQWLPLSAFKLIKVGDKSDSWQGPELILFRDNDIAETNFECRSPGAYTIFLKGSSFPAKGVYANAGISIDDVTIKVVEINSTSEGTFNAGTVKLKAGRHKIAVQFANDYFDAREDRNFILTGVGFLHQPDADAQDLEDIRLATRPGQVSLVSYNMMHFQGVSQKVQPRWAEFADKEWYPNPNKPGYYEFFTKGFKSLDADVIAIQESTVTQHDNWGGPEGAHDEMAVVPELAKRLGMNYFIQEKSRWHGFSLLSKFPIVGGKDFSHDGTPGAGLIRVTLQLDEDTRLHVYNTHLHYKDPEMRKQELIFNQKIIDKENLHPYVYVGDFNIESMSSSELNIMRANQYTGANNNVDYIWIKQGGDVHIVAFAPVRNKFTCRAVSAGETLGSDHLPVKAIIQIGSELIAEQQRKDALRKITNAERPSLRAFRSALDGAGRSLFTKELTQLITPAENENLAVSIVPVEGQHFKKALRLQTKTSSEFPWNINVTADIETPVAKGDVVIARFTARAIQTGPGQNSAELTFKFQKNVPPWTGYLEKRIRLTEEWTKFETPFIVGADYDSGAAGIIFFLGYGSQTIEIGGFRVVNYEKLVTIEQLQSAATYEEFEGITLRQY